MGLICLLTGCSTTEKISIYAPSGTKIYTPNNIYAPNGMTTPSGIIDVAIPSDMYCGYILVQSADSDIKIPIGVDYKINHHTGTKAALYTGGLFSCIGLGGCIGGGILMLAGESDTGGSVIGAGGVGALIGAAFGAPSQARLRQTSYDYNFGYEKRQHVNIPALSFKLLNPNSPKEGDNTTTEKTELASPRKKASSGKDITQETPSTTTNSSKVNKSRSDNARKIEGRYNGNGKLLLGKNIDEIYREIYVLIERIDKNHVSVRIIESDEDYFDTPLVYEIQKGQKGDYKLIIEKLPEAVIQITDSGKLTFNHKKVNIDNIIYTLEIIAEKNKE